MNLAQKIAAAVGALTLTATGIAAAGSPPEAADKGLSRAEENVDFDLPVAGANAQGDDEVVEDDADEVEDDLETTDDTDADDELTDDDATGDVSEDGGPVDNHGAEVSAVAQTEFPTGREHGEAVSAVARGEHSPQAEDDTEDDTEDEADDVDGEDTEADSDSTGGEPQGAAQASAGRGRK